ncbi:MAG: tetratricopeptide repeat protein, partial [Anaerolineaceae bacterium]|nr:tetratricopeptide repeat protein [Anaerolineaceae bacterium]
STLGEWQAAGVAFDKARTLDPENGIAWALHGEAIQHVGESGFNDLSKALELAPRSDIVNGLMAVYYRRQQKYDLAIKYLYSASESNPNEPTWQVEIGNTLALQGQLSDALIHFQVATLMDASNPVPWRALASFCVSYNYLVDSVGVEAARKALLLNPGSGSALDLMGSVYLVMGDLDSSERFLLQAEQALPGRAEILYHLGQLYLQKGDKATAFTYLRRAAEATTDARIREAANRLIQTNGGE